MNWDKINVSLDPQAADALNQASVSIPFSWYVIGAIVLFGAGFVFYQKAKQKDSGKEGNKEEGGGNK